MFIFYPNTFKLSKKAITNFLVLRLKSSTVFLVSLSLEFLSSKY